MLITLIQIISYLVSILITIVIVQFVISLLIAFNILSMSNQYVAAIYESINMILDPVLKPVRKFMPDTGMMDFSPMVLIIGLNIVQIMLSNLAASNYGV